MKMQNITRQPSVAMPDPDQFPAVRAISVADETASLRIDWLRQLEPRLQSVHLKSPDSDLLPPLPGTIPVIILHAEDPLRLVGLVQANPDVLGGRITVALCGSTQPEERALLLHAGCDDIFDLAMPHEEARARICAMHWRQSLATDSPRLIDNRMKARIRRYVALRPSQREYQTLAILAERKDQPVSVAELIQTFGITNSRAARKAMQVMISRLRRKLQPGYVIASTRKGGYTFATPG
jgi:Transcriptional regulatory protein, C terminal